MPDLSDKYKVIADKALAKLQIELGQFTIDDLVKVKGQFDINEVLVGIDLKNNGGEELEYAEGIGLCEDSGVDCLLELLDVYEVITGRDMQYRYMRAGSGDQLYRILVKVNPENPHYSYFDFNTIEEAEWNEIIDYEALDAFFESATFLIAPGKENEEPPHKFMWDDFDAVNARLRKAEANNETIHVYTLTEESGEGYIDAGYLRVNRIGYFLADKLIPMPEAIRYW